MKTQELTIPGVTAVSPNSQTATRKPKPGVFHPASDFKLRAYDAKIKRPIENLGHGWLLPYLLEGDTLFGIGRWDYWFECMTRGELPDLAEWPMPQIDFCGAPHPQTRKMLEQCLDAIPSHGSWRTWSSSTYLDYFFDWLLYGLGHKGQSAPPAEPFGGDGAHEKLYQLFQIGALQLHPYDYFGDLMADTGFGRGAGFFPTPMHVCEMMCHMTFMDGGDNRDKSTCDPCVGTGRMLLVASNHSMRLFGVDISHTCCKATLVNLALYAPWGYRPLPFLDPGRDVRETFVLQGDSIAMTGPAYLPTGKYENEHDQAASEKFAPIMVRKVKPHLEKSLDQNERQYLKPASPLIRQMVAQGSLPENGMGAKVLISGAMPRGLKPSESVRAGKEWMESIRREMPPGAVVTSDAAFDERGTFTHVFDQCHSSHLPSQFEWLAPGGRLICLTSGDFLMGTDAQDAAFREWLTDQWYTMQTVTAELSTGHAGKVLLSITKESAAV